MYYVPVDIIITPPAGDTVSDLDYNIQILNDENQIPREMPGNFEIEYQYNDGNRQWH